jgi:riboflavin synthase alpha subunit
MGFSSLSVTLYALLLVFGTVALAGISLTVCVHTLKRLVPSVVEDIDDDTSAIRLRRSHRPE